jgi:rSAM/selenodomain-associated transferase 1
MIPGGWRGTTAMSRANPEPVAIAVMAKAPVPGLAKTRLIPTIGAHAAAVLQERLTERALVAALAAGTGPVTLWCTPRTTHAVFRELGARLPVTLRQQPEGDLGRRMLATIVAADGPVLVTGTDCPALQPGHLHAAATAVRDGTDVVLIPAEDGGYVLIGMRALHAPLFDAIAWGGKTVLAKTRERITALGLTAVELDTLWDVDTDVDFARMENEHPELAL